MACFKLSKVSVEPFMFLSMHVSFLTYVALPQIILDNTCLLKHNETKCRAMFSGLYKEDFDVVQEQSTLWFGGLLVTITFIIILTLPFIGALSDHFGRYTAMFLSPICQLLQAAALLAIVLNGLPFPTWVLLLVGPIPGLVGDAGGFYVLTGSYISEITSEETRILRMAFLEGAVMVAGVSATLSSGFIIEKFGYAGIFVTNISLLVVAFVYLILCVKPANQMQKKILKEANIEAEEASSLLGDAESATCSEIHKENIEGKDVSRTEETKDAPSRRNFIEDDVNESKGESIEAPAAWTKAFEEVGEGSMADGGFGDRSDRASSAAQENETGICADISLLNESDLASEPFSALAEQHHSKIGRELSLEDNHTVHITHDMDQCDTDGIRQNEHKAEKQYGAIMPRSEKVGHNPEIKVSPEVGCNKISAHSKLYHILKESNPIRTLIRVYRVLNAEGQVFNGLSLFCFILLNAMAYSGEMSVLAMFLKNRPYFLSPRQLGFYLASESGILAIVGMVIFNFLFTRVIKLNDYISLVICLCSNTVYYILLAFAQSMLMLYLIQLIHAVGSFSTCIIRALLTKIVPAPTVGQLLGALLMFETAGVLLGSIASPIVYSKVAAIHPGAVFFINAGLTLLSIIIVSVHLVKNKNDRRAKLRNGPSNLAGVGTEG